MESVLVPVIPPDRILLMVPTSLTSTLGDKILAAQFDAPPEKPCDRCFVPESLHTAVLQTYHSPKAAGHPGKNQLF